MTGQYQVAAVAVKIKIPDKSSCGFKTIRSRRVNKRKGPMMMAGRTMPTSPLARTANPSAKEKRHQRRIFPFSASPLCQRKKLSKAISKATDKVRSNVTERENPGHIPQVTNTDALR